MLSHKGFALFELLIVIVIITCVGGFIYLSVTEKKEPETTPTPTTKVTATTIPSPTIAELPYDQKDVVHEQKYPLNECAETSPTDGINEGYVWLISVNKLDENSGFTRVVIYLSDENKNAASMKLIYTSNLEGVIQNITQNCRYIIIEEQIADAGDIAIIKTNGTLITDSVFLLNHDLIQGHNYSLARVNSSVGRNVIEVIFMGIIANRYSLAQIDLTTGKIIDGSLQVIQ